MAVIHACRSRGVPPVAEGSGRRGVRGAGTVVIRGCRATAWWEVGDEETVVIRGRRDRVVGGRR